MGMSMTKEQSDTLKVLNEVVEQDQHKRFFIESPENGIDYGVEPHINLTTEFCLNVSHDLSRLAGKIIVRPDGKFWLEAYPLYHAAIIDAFALPYEQWVPSLRVKERYLEMKAAV